MLKDGKARITTLQGTIEYNQNNIAALQERADKAHEESQKLEEIRYRKE